MTSVRRDIAELRSGRTWGAALALGLAGALAVLWVVLSAATGLIFHFHPLLIGAASTWGYRRGTPEPNNAASVVVGVVLTSILVTAGGLILSAQDEPLDSEVFMAATAAAGVAAGLFVPTRSSPVE